MKRLLVVALTLAACGTDPTAPQDPTYERDIAPLMLEYCVPCHDSRGVRDGGVELDRYEPVYAGRVKLACVSIEQSTVDEFAGALASLADPSGPPCADWPLSSMPVGATPKLTPAEQAVLARWVAAGGPR